MIDLFIVKAPVGPVKPYHQDRLAHGAIGRFSAGKNKPIATYINSPITGARMEVQYSVEELDGEPLAYVEITIPLAAATIGQNYIHAGLDSVVWEVTCAAHLVRLILISLGFQNGEVERFVADAEVQLCELTWHTSTASVKARGNLQRRSLAYFESMEKISRRHDVHITDVDYKRSNGHPGLLVTLKDGDEFRQYGKFDHALLRSKAGKQRYGLSAEMKAQRAALLESIETHARNEVRLCASSLKSLGLQHPSSWNTTSLRHAIDTVWMKLGFTSSSTPSDTETPPRKPLSTEARRTLEKYLKGQQNLEEELPPYTFTRHRKAILEFNGVDIAHTGRCPVNPTSLGRQLQYAHRWKPEQHFRKWMLCVETGPAVVLDLQRGLAYITDGVLPSIEDNFECEAWLRRWKKFVDEERLDNSSQTE